MEAAGAVQCWRGRALGRKEGAAPLGNAAGRCCITGCQDGSVPEPKNNAMSGFPWRKQKEQLMCK